MAVDPLAIGHRDDVDVVVEDVVVGELVLVVEAAAPRNLVLRRVDRDVVLPLAVEERDVLGFRRRSRVGERVVLPRVDLGDEVADAGQQRPGVAAQIAQIDDERLRGFALKERLRAFQLARIDRDRL